MPPKAGRTPSTSATDTREEVHRRYGPIGPVSDVAVAGRLSPPRDAVPPAVAPIRVVARRGWISASAAHVTVVDPPRPSQVEGDHADLLPVVPPQSQRQRPFDQPVELLVTGSRNTERSEASRPFPGMAGDCPPAPRLVPDLLGVPG